MTDNLRAQLLALGAIVLWGTLAPLGVALAHVPPFLLTGLTLLVGGTAAIPWLLARPSSLRLPWRTWTLGVYGLFGFHFLLFMALRLAPPVQANLVNYLWPLLLVVLAPALLPGLVLRPGHVLAALLGFAGAALVILDAPTSGAAGAVPRAHAGWGFAAALGSAWVWATYSLWTRRVPPFATAAIGGFGAVSGLLSLLCHELLEPPVDLALADWGLIALMGLGPMGAAFFLWDRALKIGDARQVGVLSYLTPLLSTAGLLLTTGRPLTATVGAATALILTAAWLGNRVKL